MIIVGLTGSIGMGKSTAAGMCRRLGVPVFDADRAVHRLQAPGGRAVALIDRAFPGVVAGGVIDRQALGARVFGDAHALRRLEAIVHPLVRAEQRRFLSWCARRRVPVVVLDIPLLFETGGDRRCDLVITVSAPAFLQRQRVLSRPGMSPAKLDAVLAEQMSDREKRARADVVVSTGLGKRRTRAAIARLLRRLKRHRARAWPGMGRYPRLRARS